MIGADLLTAALLFYGVLLGLFVLVAVIAVVIYEIRSTLFLRDRIKRRNPYRNRVQPFVSIIVPTYNHEAIITSFLEQLRSVAYKKYEIVLVDQVSQDTTVRLIRQFKRTYKKINLKFIARRTQTDLETVIATVLKRSKLAGEIVIIIDPTVKIQPDTIRNLVLRLEQPGGSIVIPTQCAQAPVSVTGIFYHYWLQLEALWAKTADVLPLAARHTAAVAAFNRQSLRTLLRQPRFIDTNSWGALAIQLPPEGCSYAHEAKLEIEAPTSFYSFIREFVAVHAPKGHLSTAATSGSHILSICFRVLIAALGLLTPLYLLYAFYLALGLHQPLYLQIAWLLLISVIATSIVLDEHITFRRKLLQFAGMPISFLFFCLSALLLPLLTGIVRLYYWLTHAYRHRQYTHAPATTLSFKLKPLKH